MDRNTAVARNDFDLGAPTNLNTEPQQMNGSATAHVTVSTLCVQRVIKKTGFLSKKTCQAFLHFIFCSGDELLRI